MSEKIKISQLPIATTIENEDLIPIVQNNETIAAKQKDLLTIPYFESNSHYGSEIDTFRNRYAGIRSQSSGLFENGYVEKLKVYIKDNSANATEVTGIQVWSVTKKKSISEERVTKLIKDNLTCNIITDQDNIFIEIPINQKFSEDTYFIYTLPLNPVGFKSIKNIPIAFKNDYINTTSLPAVGSAVVKGNDTYTVASEIHGRISINSKLIANKKQSERIKAGTKIFEGERQNPFNAKYFRIPSLVRTKDDVLLAFGDVRYNTGSDHSFIEIGCARSIDNGLTWDYKIAVNNENTNKTYSRVMDTTAVVTNSNRVILLNGSWNNENKWTSGTVTPKADWKAFISYSDDNGLTWTTKNISNITKPAATVGFLGGVGTGIQIQEGEYAGRIVMPIQICLKVSNTKNVVKSGCIYSTNNGESWTMSTGFTDENNSENMIIEVGGELIMSSRRDTNAGSRGAWISKDGGKTWTVYDKLNNKFTHGKAEGSGCQGSWIKYVAKNGDIIGLLSHPKNTTNSWKRDNITVYMYNFTNPGMGVVELGTPYPLEGNASGGGYSSMCYHKHKTGEETLEILYEDNGSLTFKDITYLLDIIDKKLCGDNIANLKNWTALKSTSKTPEFNNLAAKAIIKKNYVVNDANNGSLISDNRWNMIIIPVKPNTSYKFTNKRVNSASVSNKTLSEVFGSRDVIFYNTSNNNFSSATRSGKTEIINAVKGEHDKYVFKFTTSANVTHVAIKSFKENSADEELMFCVDSETLPKEYVANKLDSKIVINGDDVLTSFASIDGLTSTDLKDALIEITSILKTAITNIELTSNGLQVTRANGEVETITNEE